MSRREPIPHLCLDRTAHHRMTRRKWSSVTRDLPAASDDTHLSGVVLRAPDLALPPKG